MRIVIDMQGAQTESRFRGIGRYSLSFAQAVVRNRGEHDVMLALNGLFPETIEPIRAAFATVLPREKIYVWEAPGPVKECEPDNDSRRKTAELIREAFLLSLQPDVVHITSLFEGYVDDAVTSIGCFDRSTPVSVSLYDLIPLLNPDHYLKPNPSYARYYHHKIESLERAHACLAISEFTRQEGMQYLALPEDRFVNVSTAIDPGFDRRDADDDSGLKVLEKFALKRPFVLYTGGADERKNLPRLIKAFAALAEQLRSKYQLVFAGRMPAGQIAALKHVASSAGLKSGELCFTGYVTDQELVALYNHCRLYVFPSWHEGFGLPALEAMACGAPVIGANGSSLPEVIDLDSAMFDPFDVSDIARTMTRGLEDETFRQTLLEHGARQAKKFSWDESARRAIAAWEALPARPEGELRSTAQSWAGQQERLGAIQEKLIAEVASLPELLATAKEVDLVRLAACIDRNRRKLNNFARAADLPDVLTWRIEGPFDSSYSLALLNREIARAMASLGHTVVLHSTEGPGDFPPDEQFLAANEDIAEMHARAGTTGQLDVDVVSRNLYPPRVADMQARLNFIHAYGWEESGLPVEWVESFNQSLQGMTAMSSHVRKVLVDNGVSVPLAISSIGVDHWERIAAGPGRALDARKFRFLHVSSCFPRKGADAMLEAYGKAFRNTDDVSLVIKTFPNPHNKIHRWLKEARAEDTGFPDVQVLEKDYSDAELKALYAQCDALVAPSRAEGFGLPMAEAMLSGLAVITTNWSGQTDFCTPETAWLIDYRFQQAETHFGLFGSVWADPDVSHLAQLMREVYDTPNETRDIRIAAGRKLLLERFRWTHAAERMVEAARAWAPIPEVMEPRIGWVTTWNTRCGIATYSKHLIEKMPGRVTVLGPHTQEALYEDQPNVQRCWFADDQHSLDDLSQAIEENHFDAVVVQFNYGFFDLESFGSFLTDQADAGRAVVVMLHATTDPAHAPHKKLSLLAPALARCDRILVHAPEDLNRLKHHGLIDNVALFPHGVLDYCPPVKADSDSHQDFVVASYGFFLPHKGLLELIDAIAILRKRGVSVRLHMVNAEYPAPQSSHLIEQARKRVTSHKLDDYVSICTDFLDDAASLARLSEADLLVFPYQDTGESASGAVRYGLASGRPVAVTPLAIFSDVDAAVYKLPGQSADAIAQGIEDIASLLKSHASTASEKSDWAERWRNAHRYSHLSKRLHGMLRGLVQERRVDRDSG